MKSWYKQKTTWTAICAVVTGIGQAACGDISGGVQLIIVGLLGIFGRQAVNRLGS